MIKVLSLAGFLALASGMAWGDSIVLGSDSLVNVPTSILNPGPGTGCGLTTNCGSLGTGPYWDNISGDGTQLNAGYFLTGTGGFSGHTDYDPLQYLSQNNGAGNPNAPTAISLLSTSSTDSITFLGGYTGDNSLIFGYYNTSTMAETPLIGPGSLAGDVGAVLPTTIASGETYGLYLNRCLVWAAAPYVSPCLENTTWFSNSSLDTTDVGHQHFSIFTSATTGVFYIGVEDWVINSGEGYGDYQDMLFELNTSGSGPSVPEPATLSLIGAGLAGLGLARFRVRKNRA